MEHGLGFHHRELQNRRLKNIAVWYNDGSVFETISQADKLLRAKKIGSGCDFEGAEYDIDSVHNDKFFYVKNRAGEYTHYFLIMDAAITAEEVHNPSVSDFLTGDMEIHDTVQADVPTLLLDKTVLNDSTILI
jgi:hypothetical protein